MALPAEEWRRSAARCWAALEPALKERLAAAPLGEALRVGCGYLRPEEAALRELCGRARTGKEPAAARFYREEGNRRFGRCCYRDAVRLYSQVCLEDIARAESHGYPDRLLPKVLLRKAECLLRLGRLQDATETLTAAENKMATDGIMTSPIHHTLLKKLSQLKNKIREESCPKPAQEAHGDVQRESEIWEENGIISGASSSLSLNFNPERGRHLVASQDILPGQNLLKEKAFVSVLCPGFSEVSRLVGQLHDDDKRDLCNAEAGGEHPSEALHTRAGTKGIPGCNDNGQYQSSYQAVFNLLPHVEKHSPEHKFICMLSVVAVCKKLQETGLEAAALSRESSATGSEQKACEKTSDELSPELMIMAEAMLRHVLQLQCNAQAITVMQELESGDGAVVNKKPVRLATAFFPVLSLLNHSCSPNISVSFSGTAVTVRASQPIPSGQEIFHCYDEAIRMLLKCQMDARNFLSPEHLLMGELEDHLAQVYATLGKWQEAARHLERSIQFVEMHHGPSSIEMGHELFKLAQILFNGFAVSEALSAIQRAEEILSVHCGPQSTQIQELQEMKTCLLELPRSILQRT
ncbi:UNVERIFIED_CONTAM: hypothetical protein H355_017055 [Colinus virginianus]|nr:hypothetical protein H355_017055 [Colinus virginianus]